MHTEGLAHCLGLIFLSLEVLCHIRQHVVLWDDVDTLDSPDIEVTVRSTDHISNNIVDGVRLLIVDAEQP